MEPKDELLDQLKIAVTTREKGNLKASRGMLIKLLKKAKPLAISSAVKDQRLLVRIWHEWIIQLRHEGKEVFRESLSQAKELYKWANSKELKDFYAIHNLAVIWMDLRDFETPQRYFREMMQSLPTKNSPLRAYTLAHYAECLFRAGRIKESYQKAKEALKNLDDAHNLEEASWKVHALMTLAVISRVLGDGTASKSSAREAARLAEKHKLSLYQKKANELLEYLD